MLCAFANSFPAFVEDFLGRSRLLRRRFREETITDLMMGSLITAGAGRVIVEFPDETVTGADMEWNFVNPDDSTFFRIFLQAKQAYGDGAIWMRHGYRELLYTAGLGSKLQAEILCDAARNSGVPTYPLYIFYNPGQTCKLARRSGNLVVTGVTLADGYVIERLVKGATTRLLRTRNKSLGTIAPYFFPLTDIFCPQSVLPLGQFALAPGMFRFPLFVASVGKQMVFGAAIPPTPHEIRQRLIERRSAFEKIADNALIGIPEVPDVAGVIPDEVQAAISRRRKGTPHESSIGLSRWRVTFVSAGVHDDSRERRLDDEQ